MPRELTLLFMLTQTDAPELQEKPKNKRKRRARNAREKEDLTPMMKMTNEEYFILPFAMRPELNIYNRFFYNIIYYTQSL